MPILTANHEPTEATVTGAAWSLLAVATGILLLRHWPAVMGIVTEQTERNRLFELVVLAGMAWLVWRNRDEFKALRPAPNPWGLAFAIGLGLGLWISALVDIRLAELILLIAAVVVVAWTVFGSPALKAFGYPAAILLLALPFWRHLEPLLQHLTVAATVRFFRALGVPVFVDATYIRVPQGTVMVLAECSGVQFLQAGVTLGAIYACAAFNRASERLAVAAGFGIASILGNWLRVFTLIALGNVSELQHLNIGWGVFMASIAPVVWWTTRWTGFNASATQGHAPKSRAARRSSIGLVGGLAAAATVILAWPGLHVGRASQGSAAQVHLQPTAATDPWRGPFPPASDWKPTFQNVDAVAAGTYLFGEDNVELYWAYYGSQSQGREVINDRNSPFDRARWHPRGGNTAATYRQISLAAGQPLTVAEVRLEHRDTGAERLVWYWYCVAGTAVARPWQAKLAQLTGLGRDRTDAFAIAVSAEAGNVDETRKLLRGFLGSHWQSLDSLPREIQAKLSASRASSRTESGTRARALARTN